MLNIIITQIFAIFWHPYDLGCDIAVRRHNDNIYVNNDKVIQNEYIIYVHSNVINWLHVEYNVSIIRSNYLTGYGTYFLFE